MVARGGILKVLHDDRVILEGKKRIREHYYLAGSLVRDGASGVRKSPKHGGAPGGGRSDTRRET